MAQVWVLDTETKGTGAEMVPLEKVLKEPGSGRALILAPDSAKRVEPPAPGLLGGSRSRR